MGELRHSPVTRAFARDGLAAVVADYSALHDESRGGTLQVRKRRYAAMAISYYNLATDFYEYGWCHSFHFAPRRRGESLEDSLRRHQHSVAASLELRPGMTALDMGSGIGGPMREIARFSGARVVGLNNNAYQIGRSEELNRQAGMTDLVSHLEGDFMDIPAEDASFDAVFQLQSTSHAADRVRVYSEIRRVLRPGGLFVSDEYGLTPAYDAGNPAHRKLKKDIEYGSGMPDLARFEDITEALDRAGFELLEARDAGNGEDGDLPWHDALGGQEFRLRNLPRTPLGRRITDTVLRILEKVGAVPAGATEVAVLLSTGAAAYVGAGRLGIFTPNYFTKARKPDRR